ncbi:MAG TPA: histidine phosphatase family protein [Candidatus Angelobacter sp.]|nr:histidine phosphatase family protein [Candidatus Angelobacter sp.]
MTARRVVLWRHGRTTWNAESRFQGTTDVPLDDVGLAQAERAAHDLATLSPYRIVSSDLQRARATAEVLAAVVGLEVEVDPDLRETYAGSWQGLLREEILATDGDTLRRWLNGDDVRPGGGETRTEVAARVSGAVLRHVAELPTGGTLVIASHGGAVRSCIGTLLGLPVEHWAALGGLVNCAWSVLEEQPGNRWRLVEHNARSLPEEVVGDES